MGLQVVPMESPRDDVLDGPVSSAQPSRWSKGARRHGRSSSRHSGPFGFGTLALRQRKMPCRCSTDGEYHGTAWVSSRKQPNMSLSGSRVLRQTSGKIAHSISVRTVLFGWLSPISRSVVVGCLCHCASGLVLSQYRTAGRMLLELGSKTRHRAAACDDYYQGDYYQSVLPLKAQGCSITFRD